MVPGFCVWEVPGKAVTIHLDLTVVDLLNVVIQGLGFPPQELEVGGLLLGRTELDTRRQIFIEDFTPVPCEHQFGSGYYLSDSDGAALSEKTALWQAGPGKDMYVVGYYRSHQREGFHLDEADVAIAREYFSDPANVFLLIQPFPTQVSVGGFFFWEDHQIQRKSNLLFPFSPSHLIRGETILPHVPQDERELLSPEHGTLHLPPHERQLPPQDPAAGLRRSGQDHLAVQTVTSEQDSQGPDLLAIREKEPDNATQQVGDGSNQASSHSPEYTDQPLLPQMERVAANRRSPLPWILSLGILVVILVGMSYPILRRSQILKTKTTVGDLAELALNVAIENNLLRVSWNKSSPLIVSAKSGVLSVMDGPFQEDLNLDVEQLHSGSLLYPHLTGDITFRLHVVASNREASESLRLVGANRFTEPLSASPVTIEPQRVRGTTKTTPMKPVTGAQGIEVKTPEAPDPTAAPSSAMSLPRGGFSEAGDEHKSSHLRAGGAKVEPSRLAPAEQAKAVPISITPGSRGASRGMGEMELHAPLEPLSKAPELTRPPEGIAAVQQQPMPPPLNEAAEARSPQEALTSAQVYSVTAVLPEHPQERIDYVAPQPLRRVAPFLPASLRRLAIANVRISVKLEIDATGRIVRVESLSKGNSLIDYLSGIALDAARQWQFSPARRGNQNVAGETVLMFQFSNSAE